MIATEQGGGTRRSGRIHEQDSPSGVVYICYGPDRRVLYVGQTIDWQVRRKAHMASAWWELTQAIHFVPVTAGIDRLTLERVLIHVLAPEFNITHAGRRVPNGMGQWRDADLCMIRRGTNARRDESGSGPREIGTRGVAVRAKPPAQLSPVEPDRLLNVDQSAERLGVSRREFLAMCRAGQVPKPDLQNTTSRYWYERRIAIVAS